MPLKILDIALVLLCGLFGGKGAEVASLSGARIFLARIESVFAAGEFADHRCTPLFLAVKPWQLLWFRAVCEPPPAPS
jgi:hypothetical protein